MVIVSDANHLKWCVNLFDLLSLEKPVGLNVVSRCQGLSRYMEMYGCLSVGRSLLHKSSTIILQITALHTSNS